MQGRPGITATRRSGAALVGIVAAALLQAPASAGDGGTGDDRNTGGIDEPIVLEPAANEPVVDEPIDELVVVAHKHARPLRDVAANVSVFTAADIRSELGSSMADVFRYAPGVDFETAGSRFGAESVSIRGISGNRVAMLLDGVPIGDQFDVGSFSNATRDFVDAGFVDQVEVLHGPASALYGSAAIGGVVAIATPDPRRLAGASGQGGSLVTGWREDRQHGTAIHAVAGDSLALLAGVSLRDGTQSDAAAVKDNLDHRDFQSRSGLLKLLIDDRWGNTWQAAYYRQRSDVLSELNSMLGSGRFRRTTALGGDDDYHADIFKLEYRFSAGSALVDDGVVRAYYQDSEVGQRSYDERGLAARPVAIDRYFSFDQQVQGIEANLQKQFTTGSLDHRLGFGLEYRRRDTEEYRDGLETGLEDGLQTNVLLGETFPLRDFPISRTVEWGAFVENTMTAGRWSVIAAVRADRYDMQPRVDVMYAEDYPFAAPVSISESDLSPKLGLIYRVAAATEVYVQYSHGFRAPPYEDANISLEVPLFNYRAMPNPDLRSERSGGIDVGLRWRGANASARLSLFRTEYDDFIESKVRIGPDPLSGRILFQSQNITRALIEGIEAGGSWTLPVLNEGLSVDVSLYAARSENRDNGEPLNSVGPPQGIAGINWASVDKRWQVSLRGTFTDDWSERDESSGELFEPPGHAVFDLFVTRRLGDHLTLRSGFLNLSDKTYWAWSDVRGLAPDDPVIPYLSRPGRGITLGLDMNW